MHTKIAEPHPIFNKDKNKSNAKANLFTFYGHEIEMYTVEQGEKRDKRQ